MLPSQEPLILYKINFVSFLAGNALAGDVIYQFFLLLCEIPAEEYLIGLEIVVFEDALELR